MHEQFLRKVCPHCKNHLAVERINSDGNRLGKVTYYCSSCFIVYETESVFDSYAKLEPLINSKDKGDILGKLNATIEAYEDLALLKQSEIEILRAMLLRNKGNFFSGFRNFNWVLFFMAKKAYQKAKGRAQRMRRYKDEYVQRKALQTIADLEDLEKRRNKDKDEQ